MFNVFFFFFWENNALSLIKKEKQMICRNLFIDFKKRGLPYGTRGPRT